MVAPSKFLTLLVGMAADPESRESVLADLEEEFEGQVRDHGPRAARRWYRGQVFRSAGPLAWRRLTRRDAGWRMWRRSVLGQDAAFAFRTLGRAPGFTLAVVLTLALGIGANTAVFSLVHSLLIDPLPFPGGDRLVQLWREGRQEGERVLDRPGADMVAAWRREATGFDVLVGYTQEEYQLTGTGYPVSVGGSRISPELLTLIGATPLRGRLLSSADAVSGTEPVVLLSEELWATQYGGDPGVVGRTVDVDGVPRTVVGIVAAPARRTLENAFFGGRTKAVFLPLESTADGAWPARPYVVARLHPGVTIAEARAQLDVIQTHVPRAAGGYQWYPHLVTPVGALPRDFRTGLWMLMGAVGMVLLIACGNTANILVVRNRTRLEEFRVRLALGAGRLRMARQLVTETVVLVGAGLILAAVTARWVIAAGEWIAGNAVGEIRGARLDPAAFAFAIGLGVVTLIISSFVPLRHVMRLTAASTSDLSRQSERVSRGGWRMQETLVVAQVALALVLTLGAGLLSRSLWRLLDVDPGMDTHGLVAMRIDLPQARYDDAAGRIAFFDQLTRRVQALPAVSAASWARAVPPSVFGAYGRIVVEGRAVDESEPEDVHAGDWVAPGYFRAVGMSILEGRSFTRADVADEAPVVVLNRSSAERYWPLGGAVGSRIALASGGHTSPWLTVVGVVPDVKAWWLGDRADRIQVYLPVSDQTPRSGVLLVRSTGTPDQVIRAVRGLVADADPLLPVGATFLVEDRFRQSVGRQRFHALILDAFGGLGLLLAVLGVYGVLALSVSRRRQEIGVRLALGATRGRITRLVVGQGMKAVATGVVLGLVLSYILARYIRTLLWGIEATDVTTYLAAVGLLGIAGLLASYLPTRRAASVDPVETLRLE
jgi:putative ABC transport system permease protein